MRLSFRFYSPIIAIALLFQSCGLFEGAQKETQKEQPPEEKAEEKREELIDTVSVKKTAKDSLDKVYPQVFKDTYDVALILPLFLEKEMREKDRNKKISEVATDFYMGAKLALDTLSSCGKTFQVHVFDNAKDSARLASIHQKIAERDIDLILGPFYTELVKQTSAFAKEHQINHFAPLAYVQENLSDNPYYVSIKPSPEVYARKAAQFIHSQYQKPNVFLVRSYDELERKVGFCLDTIVDTNQIASYNHLTLKEDDWNTAEIFRDTLKKENNLLIIPSENQVFTTSIIGNLKAVDTIAAYEDDLDNLPENLLREEVTILGLTDWLNYESMEGNTMQRFNMHFMGDHYVNYQSLSTRDFVKEYRKHYYTEPSKFAFKGYDLSLLAGMMLANYGKYFERTWYEETTSLLHNDFNFKQIRGQKGWQNFHLRLLRYQDYEVKMIGE